ncbi:hypothetical protein [Flavobacterium degerlachei]|jgi:hypothetical protein|uniref:MetA-pathway of phenol degradation n=1 Tax=Flavobacterium degerlachei TaxID=229203 RepID=A0A1H2Q741_9FLAO|nr:hypothetical protein [Flavobacterium degerlachei]SDW03027.1 hypothetical protein SAMN05444338_101114 [Flavobacterium degerlachei]
MKKPNQFYIYFILLIYTLLQNQKTIAQGCVAIKGNATSCMMIHPDSTNVAGWQLATSGRYFRSFRHFSGTEENKQRLIQKTEVVNYTSVFNLSLIRNLNNRWSIMIDIPVSNNVRSSLYEHGLVNGTYIKKERHSTSSFGIGDIRFAAYRWLLDPTKSTKANIQLGLGLKLPTGDYNYKDYWYNVGQNGGKELRPVDQSIQLGDGGTGITFELNTFYNFVENFGVYGNFYYLINPREQNGTRTYRETLSPNLANEAIMSVPDQYMFRAGFNYSFHRIKGLSLAAGTRLEGIPVYDLLGGSSNFRRPGYIWSIEPSVNYDYKKVTVFASVPFAVARNRTQSVTDKENSVLRATHVQGDAAFADYTLNLGVSTRF